MNQSVTLQLSTSTSAFERGVAAAIALLSQLGNTASQTGTQINQYATNLNTRLTAAYAAADARQRIFDAGLGRLAGNLQNVGGKLSTYLTAPLLAAGAAAFKTYADIDALKRGLAVIEGPAGNVNARFKELREVAALPGLGLEEAVKGDIRLRAVGISAALSKKSLLEFGNAIALTGGGKAQLDLVTTQLGQMAAKGKVLGNDLRPIIESATAAAPVIKRLFGTIDPEEISKKLKLAGKNSTDFIELVTGGLSQLQRVSGGPKNAIENLGDALKIASYEFVSAADKSLDLTGKLNSVGSFISNLATSFSGLSPTTQSVILGLIGAAAALGPIILGIGYLIPLLPALGTAFTVGFGAITGPVGIAVAAITAGAYLIISNWDSIKKVLVDTGIWDTVSRVVTTTVATVSGAFTTGIAFLKSVWDEFGGSIISVGRSAFETVSVLVQGYMSVISAEIDAGVTLFRSLWAVFGDDIINIGRGAFTALSGIISGAFSVIGTLFSSAAGVLTGIFKTITGVLTGDWGKLREGLQNITVSLWNGVLGLFVAGVTATGGVVAGFLQTVGADTLAAKVQAQVASVTANVNGLKVALQDTQSAASGASRAAAQIPTKPKPKPAAPESVDAAPAIDFSKLGGDSYIKQLKDRQKALAEQIQSGNAAGQDTSKLQSEYNKLTAQIDKATESTKKRHAAGDSGSGKEYTELALVEGIYKRLIDEQQKYAAAGTIAPTKLLNNIETFKARIEEIKNSLVRTKIDLPIHTHFDGTADARIIKDKQQFGKTPETAGFDDLKVKTPPLSTVTARLDIKIGAAAAVEGMKQELDTAFASVPAFLTPLGKSLGEQLGAAFGNGEVLGPFQNAVDNLKQGFASARQGLGQGMAGIFEGLGEAVAGNGNILGTLLKGVLDMIGNYLITVGTALITSSLLLDTNPFTAVFGTAQGLQGAAMIAGGGLIKGLGAVLKFAKGGVFDSPTFGLFGEYAGAAHNKEIATPQKLMADTFRGELQKDAYRQSPPSLPSGSGSQRMEVVVSGSLKGEDIHFAQSRYVERYGNLTGG